MKRHNTQWTVRFKSGAFLRFDSFSAAREYALNHPCFAIYPPIYDKE